MDSDRLALLLDRFDNLSVLVVGDFFLDKYLIIDPAFSETSLETGLEVYQVIAMRPQPGAAGTVTSNLKALDVGEVLALTVIGDDGQGYELKAGLSSTGVDCRCIIGCPHRFTPTYTKPMVREPGKPERELNRLDIKNRTPLDLALEDRIMDRLREVVPRVHGVIIADQVQERNCGVITDRVREEIAALARANPETVFLADSRTRIGLFESIMLKPNRYEVVAVIYPDHRGEPDRVTVGACGRALSARTGEPVFVTLGQDGILIVCGDDCHQVPGVKVTGEIDIVGAGDSVTAGIVSALCAGATLEEAATIGNLVASLTIQQLGTTGTTTRADVARQFEKYNTGDDT